MMHKSSPNPVLRELNISHHDVKKSFGAAVRLRRKLLGITQEALAERAGMHRTYICDVERGTRNVSLEAIEKIACALDSDIPSLFSHGNPRYWNGKGAEPSSGS